jgi:AcrR family transcriptional regulator
MRPAAKRKTTSGKSKKYHHGDLRDTILKEAVPLLRALGPQAFNMREVAKRLKVSGAAPYRHFKSKDEIFFRLVEDGFKKLTTKFKSAIQSHPLEPAQQMIAIAKGYYEFATEYPEHLQLMFGNYLPVKLKQADVSLNEAATELFLTLISAVQSCQLVKLLPPESPSDIMVVKIWSAIHGYSILESGGLLAGTIQAPYNKEKLAEELMLSILYGLNLPSRVG